MKKALYKLTEYILIFLLAAFFGWLYEIACVYYMWGCYIDRGVLHLPLCPIYGFGILVLMFIFRKTRNFFVLFIGSALIATAVELAASYVLEYLFHTELWSYEPWPLDFEGRISAVSRVFFGLLAALYLKLVRPLIGKIYKTKAGRYVSAFVVVLTVFCVCWELRFL